MCSREQSKHVTAQLNATRAATEEPVDMDDEAPEEMTVDHEKNHRRELL